MDLCISLLIFDFYLYIYMGAQGEPVWWFTAVGSSSGDACWHGSLAMMALFFLGLWVRMGLLLHCSFL
jgi:hypothetical protein